MCDYVQQRAVGDAGIRTTSAPMNIYAVRVSLKTPLELDFEIQTRIESSFASSAAGVP